MKSRFHIYLAAAIMMIAAGCSSTSVIEIDGSADSDASINYKGSSVDVKVLNTQTKSVNGLLQVNVTLESGDSDTYLADYKFEWFDADGMGVEVGRQAWMPLYFYGRETKAIQGLSPNPSAKSFKLLIRQRQDQDYY